MKSASGRWSSWLAFNLAAVGAAVGLGSIWRFPYLAGTNGGSTFLLVFVLACVAIATPLLVAEFMIGRRSRLSPPAAAGQVAATFGYSRSWNWIGVLGTVAGVLIMSNYTVIAGWVSAYAWKCASGEIMGLTRPEIAAHFSDFLANPWQVGFWNVVFLALVGFISARGLNRGIEIANKIRAPGLLILLLALVAYALLQGDAERGLTFAFQPDLSKLSPDLVLAAVGQAFYATGVGMAMMLAYGAYVPGNVSLVRSALLISASIVVVSVLATAMVFPLVFQYGLDPAQGPDLVFNVLPTAFVEMPAGRLVGTLFFILLVLAALTPSIAGMEPMVAWLQQRRGYSRSVAVLIAILIVWFLALGSVLSFNVWKDWHPLAWTTLFQHKTVFDIVDFVSSNVLLPLGALLTCAFVGWRLPASFDQEELAVDAPALRRLCRILLKFVCPLAIGAVLLAAL
ncbi:sodium-dependent transporter [Steroidobacter sp.]|uniref:sodium-dependent transporter n=1 Tax=Steroidobacter sp. TaxID=1978227 RepID=UPI001A53B96C|nr:sodium-dependent transporter [Steroidobacter sp.]MBL8270261.1 sodium-dependent transporter [Steroidobacter sp.]